MTSRHVVSSPTRHQVCTSISRPDRIDWAGGEYPRQICQSYATIGSSIECSLKHNAAAGLAGVERWSNTQATRSAQAVQTPCGMLAPRKRALSAGSDGVAVVTRHKFAVSTHPLHAASVRPWLSARVAIDRRSRGRSLTPTPSRVCELTARALGQVAKSGGRAKSPFFFTPRFG